MTCDITIPKYPSKIWELKQIYVLPLRPCERLHNTNESTRIGLLKVVMAWLMFYCFESLQRNFANFSSLLQCRKRSFKTRQQQSNWNPNSLNSPDLGFCLHAIHCGIEIVHTVYRFFELSIIGFQSITCLLDNDKIRSLQLILGTFEKPPDIGEEKLNPV